MDMEVDYLALEPLFVARVLDQVPGLKAVQGVPDLATVSEKQQVTPAVYVIYLGDQPGSDDDTVSQLTTQLWAVVLAVHYADADGSGAGARRIAGPLLGQLLKRGVLRKWVPRPDVKALRRLQTNTPAEYADGYGYFPLVFAASFVN